MKLTPEQIEGIALVLLKVRTDSAIKLKYGAALRQSMKDKIAKGEKVTGYRAEWHLEARKSVILFMQQLANEFNEKYQQDRCSIGDMVDVAASVMDYLRHLQTKD